MRTPRVFVIGLALAGLVGCGSAFAAETSPSWSPASATTTTDAAAAPSVTPSVAPSTAAPSPSPSHTPSSAPPSSKAPAKPKDIMGGPSDSQMKTGSEGVALTFDDGPDPATTPELLDMLKSHHVKATFCLVGQNAKQFPDLVKRIADEGHTLCNHTWKHDLKLGKKKPEQIRDDLQRTNDAILAAAPGAKVEYMRAPGGNFTKNFVKVADELGMKSIYWYVDTRDWDHSGGESDSAHTQMVIRSVKKHTRPGAIVLSHDYAQPDTIAAYRTLLPWLKQRYKLIALPVS